MTIVEFIAARLDEEEAAALRVKAGPNGPVVCVFGRPTAYLVEAFKRWSPPESEAEVRFAEHAARHDPARVLADIRAKRTILALHQDAGMRDCAHSTNPCPTLRALAAPHADHPDYDPAWSPA